MLFASISALHDSAKWVHGVRAFCRTDHWMRCEDCLTQTVSLGFLPGVAATLAEVFKAAPRGQAAALAMRLTGLALSLGELPAAASSSLARRLLVKLAVRMALALLPPAPVSWRHTTRVAALHATLQRPRLSAKASTADAAAHSGNAMASSVYDVPPATPASSAVVPPDQAAEHADGTAEAEEADAVPAVHIADEVEDIAGQLLQSLQDPDTVVRCHSHLHLVSSTPVLSQLWQCNFRHMSG